MFKKTTNILHPAASERNSESCGTSTQLNKSLGQNCSISAKRKAPTTSESSRKRQRCASRATQLAFEAVPAKGGKRKDKRGPSCTNCDEAIGGANLKEQGNAEKLPTSQAPEAANREHACDPSPSPSASNSGTATLQFARSRACFEEKYVEDSLLGRGGFGSVYAGRRKADNLPVAIKHIQKQHVHCHNVVYKGKTCIVPLEAFLMLKVGAGPKSLGTSAVVAVLDWFELRWELILIMERPVPCESLRSYMEKKKGKRLKEDVAKNITKQLVDAALTMHTKGVFHRDIKAENLLLETGSNDPRVRIIDFGCGCLVQEEPYSSFSGTSAYAPPEHFKNKRYEAGPTTVWQLGALLHEMLDGAQLFSTSRFLRGKISFTRRVSPDCRKFWRQCLTPDPQRRATLEQLKLHPWLQN